MGFGKMLCIASVQIALIFGYVYHQSSISQLYYQYQKAHQTYTQMLKQREQLRQSIQSDHDYSRILNTARQKGMRPIRLADVAPIPQDTS